MHNAIMSVQNKLNNANMLAMIKDSYENTRFSSGTAKKHRR